MFSACLRVGVYVVQETSIVSEAVKSEFFRVMTTRTGLSFGCRATNGKSAPPVHVTLVLCSATLYSYSSLGCDYTVGRPYLLTRIFSAVGVHHTATWR